MDDFLRLGLGERFASALASFGFSAPTPVQTASIPLVLAGRDLFMESETGSGKTFAYLAPTLGAKAAEGEKSRRYIAVVVPTQELAAQVAREASRLAHAAGMHAEVALMLGGSPLSRQESAMKRNPAIIVGTLGRMHDLVKAGIIDNRRLGFAIIDEADRMLVPETRDELIGLLGLLPVSCQRIIVSATLPDRVRKALSPFLRNPASASGDSVLSLPEGIEHWAFSCDSRKRVDFVRSFEAAVHPARCLVFMSQGSRVALAAEKLLSKDLPVASVSAGMDKEERRVAIERFAEGKLRYLVTSDLAARGLDIPGISHVLSLDLPDDPILYLHRAGRTGRAGARGTSVILADMIELGRASKIAQRCGFVFRCKVLSKGTVQEPPVDEFFAIAENEWSDRQHSREGEGSRRQWGEAPAYPDTRIRQEAASRSGFRQEPQNRQQPDLRFHADTRNTRDGQYNQPRPVYGERPDRPPYSGQTAHNRPDRAGTAEDREAGNNRMKDSKYGQLSQRSPYQSRTHYQAGNTAVNRPAPPRKPKNRDDAQDRIPGKG